MPHKGLYTQGVCVLFAEPIALDSLCERLQGYGIARRVEPPDGSWPIGGPTLLIPYKPEVNGYVSVDTVSRRWPDGR